MASLAHSTPKTSVSFFRFWVDASRIELRGKEGNVFDDGQADAPLLVFGELDNRREEGLRQQLDADDCPSQYIYSELKTAHLPLLTDSSFEMMFRRTSGNSSLSI